jgi:hypothetical protein
MKPFYPDAYSEPAAAAIVLPLPDHCKPGVGANLARLAAMAALVMDFALPDEAEE